MDSQTSVSKILGYAGVIAFILIAGGMLGNYLMENARELREAGVVLVDPDHLVTPAPSLHASCKTRNQLVWELFSNQYSLTIDSASADLVAIGLVEATGVVDLVMETMETLQMGCVER